MPKRVLMVCDGEKWFVRGVACTVEDNIRGEMVYHCDEHLGGPYSFAKAVSVVREASVIKKRKRNGKRT